MGSNVGGFGMKRSSTVACVIMVTYVGIVAPALGDVIELKDGSKYTGTMTRENQEMVIRIADTPAKVIRVKPGDVARVTLGNSASSDDTSTAEWTRLNAQIKAAKDLQTITT